MTAETFVHPLLSGPGTQLSPRFVQDYDLGAARMILAVGSQLEQTADPSSDIDVLAVFGGPPPQSVPAAGVVDMRTLLGPNWIGWFDTTAGRREVNVECLSVEALHRMGEQLAPEFGPHRAPLLQALEVRTLSRLRTALPLAPDDAHTELDRLRDALHLDRLGAFVALVNVVGGESYLRLAEGRIDDPLGCHIALSSVVEGILLSSLALDGRVLYDLKKISAVLRRAADDRLDPTLDLTEVTAMLTSANPAAHVSRARQALAAVRDRIASRAALGPGVWAEVHAALQAPVAP
ncbi:MAG: hypothetical protein QM638_15160 [Nocardioides sp.]|uniref:hypothetical protein n=1 Tax=Nocardioides sp. TaxID=35761 RepID=UPI0039E5C2D5